MDRRKFEIIFITCIIFIFFPCCIIFNPLKIVQLQINENQLEIYLNGKQSPGSIRYVEFFYDQDNVSFKAPPIVYMEEGFTYEKDFKKYKGIIKIKIPSETLKYGRESIRIKFTDGYIKLKFIIWNDKHKENEIIKDEDLKNCRIGLIESWCSFGN